MTLLCRRLPSLPSNFFQSQCQIRSSLQKIFISAPRALQSTYAAPASSPPIPRVASSAPATSISALLSSHGAVVRQNVLPPPILSRLNASIDPHPAPVAPGSTSSDPWVQAFHGSNTRRLARLAALSPVFRSEILDSDLLHATWSEIFTKDAGEYWLSGAQVIDVGPGSEKQMLHRDGGNYPLFMDLGPKAPEAMVNHLIALTDFTEENGATRVVLGSQLDEDFGVDVEEGMRPETVVEMKAGDALLLSGKVAHGAGANTTASERRRALSLAVCAAYLTPEESHVGFVKWEDVRELPERVQRMLGFRAVYPRDSPGLWMVDGGDLGEYTEKKSEV